MRKITKKHAVPQDIEVTNYIHQPWVDRNALYNFHQQLFKP
jgi:hypothetical protein